MPSLSPLSRRKIPKNGRTNKTLKNHARQRNRKNKGYRYLPVALIFLYIPTNLSRINRKTSEKQTGSKYATRLPPLCRHRISLHAHFHTQVASVHYQPKTSNTALFSAVKRDFQYRESLFAFIRFQPSAPLPAYAISHSSHPASPPPP